LTAAAAALSPVFAMAGITVTDAAAAAADPLIRGVKLVVQVQGSSVVFSAALDAAEAGLSNGGRRLLDKDILANSDSVFSLSNGSDAPLIRTTDFSADVFIGGGFP
jgi:hypothetical protein